MSPHRKPASQRLRVVNQLEQVVDHGAVVADVPPMIWPTLVKRLL